MRLYVLCILFNTPVSTTILNYFSGLVCSHCFPLRPVQHINTFSKRKCCIFPLSLRGNIQYLSEFYLHGPTEKYNVSAADSEVLEVCKAVTVHECMSNSHGPIVTVQCTHPYADYTASQSLYEMWNHKFCLNLLAVAH